MRGERPRAGSLRHGGELNPAAKAWAADTGIPYPEQPPRIAIKPFRGAGILACLRSHVRTTAGLKPAPRWGRFPPERPAARGGRSRRRGLRHGMGGSFPPEKPAPRNGGDSRRKGLRRRHWDSIHGTALRIARKPFRGAGILACRRSDDRRLEACATVGRRTPGGEPCGTGVRRARTAGQQTSRFVGQASLPTAVPMSGRPQAGSLRHGGKADSRWGALRHRGAPSAYRGPTDQPFRGAGILACRRSNDRRLEACATMGRRTPGGSGLPVDKPEPFSK